MIAAGKLNRRLTIYAPVATRSATGAQTKGWTELGKAWAAQETLLLREVNRMAGMVDAAESKFLIRYRADITTGNEVEHDGRRYSVVSVEERDNRQGLALFVRAI